MNEYQKAVARGIENGLNDHFNRKTKKVWLTVEEAKVIAIFFGAVDACCDLRMSKTEQKVWRKLNKLIGQAERENA